MKLFSNKGLEKYFFTKESSFKTNKTVDLILSPEFYWVRIFEIPVESAQKAKKLLPTLFEDVVASNSTLNYFCVHKEKNLFLCFAFSSTEIYDAIKQSGLKQHQINHVYFAQNHMYEYEQFAIGEFAYMYENDILIKVPKTFCSNAQTLNEKIDSVVLDKPIDIKHYNNLISDKHIFLFSILFFIVLCLNVAKFLFVTMETQEKEQQIVRLKQDNDLPKTSLQMQSIINNMRLEKSLHKRFKDTLYYILNFKKIIPKDSIVKISFKNEKFFIVFKSSNPNRIKRYLKSKLQVLNSNVNQGFLKVEVSI